MVLTYFCGQLDTYVLAQYPLFEEFVYLVLVYKCRIRNRAKPFVAHKRKSRQYRGWVQYTLMAVTKELKIPYSLDIN